MAQITADEFIINTVRLNKYVYDRTEECYKNLEKRKDLWKMISVTLKNCFDIEMSAEAVERRWATLRDLFGRELRKRRLPAYKNNRNNKTPRKEWMLFNSMEFLTKHYFRRGKNHYIEIATPKNENESNNESTESPETEETLPPKNWDPIEEHAYACDTKPETEDTSEDTLVTQLAEVNKVISTVMSTLTKMLANQDRSEYAHLIEEGLNRVPNANKTQCLIEMLQVIKKFEQT